MKEKEGVSTSVKRLKIRSPIILGTRIAALAIFLFTVLYCKVGNPANFLGNSRGYLLNSFNVHVQLPVGDANLQINQTSSECTSGDLDRLTKEISSIKEDDRNPNLNGSASEKLRDRNYGVPLRMLPRGFGSYLFIQSGAYRGGPKTFAVIGLGPKPLHDYGDPGFLCEWVASNRKTVKASTVSKFKPDRAGLSHQYTTLVVHCNFDAEVGTDGKGGELIVIANHGPSDHTGLKEVRFSALKEHPGDYNASLWIEEPRYPYDYVYCGSPLYGDLSPQRVREWIAYHTLVMGAKSHFFIYDAGAMEGDVKRILEPWIKIGRVTLVNGRQQERFDSYYHNQALLLNHCLFNARILAKWAFFFDLDEFLALPKTSSLDDVMSALGDSYRQIKFMQVPVSVEMCKSKHGLKKPPNGSSLWGFENFVYRRFHIPRERGDLNRKYAIQPKFSLVAGVHYSYRVMGRTKVEDLKLRYFHYHGNLNKREEGCGRFVGFGLANITNDKFTYLLDESVAHLGKKVRAHEFQQVGSQPFIW